MTPSLAPLTVVTGGAASGKSCHAEALIRASARPRLYIATAQAFDDEMSAKIARHQSDRGADWITVDAPLDPMTALTKAPADHVVLLDCATLWLTNVLLADLDPVAATDKLITALDTAAAPVIVVTNELGQGVVPADAFTRRFRQAHGEMNQRLAAAADQVIAVISGLPLTLKS